MSQIDLSAGVVVSSNPYTNFMRRIFELQLNALNSSEAEVARMESIHPMMLTLELLSIGGDVAAVQFSRHPETSLFGKQVEREDDLAALYADALRPVVLGVLMTTPPAEELDSAMNHLQRATAAGIKADPGGVAAFFADTVQATVTQSPVMYLQALLSLLMSAAYAGVTLDDLLARYGELLPKPSLLVTP